MNEVLDIKDIIANNISEQRKNKGWTQLELAQKLNYSDKAVSKWERAEAFPDIIVLKQLSDLFGITLDDLVSVGQIKKLSSISRIKKHKLFIPFLSAVLVWLIATIVFVFLVLFSAPVRPWLAFIYAIPASAIVLIVFNAIWGKKILSLIIISVLVWSILLSIVITLTGVNSPLLFLIGIPLQILVILWYMMRIKSGKTKKP